ncbi:unnamed protein product [Polarella glacialis]|uniref:Uncharacterized protein n=1 Tax=Polarella glacialis TaxID=89957 RepID=A0A813H135_POLGL|nr:unnamed protein product [Polarella glacialis]
MPPPCSPYSALPDSDAEAAPPAGRIPLFLATATLCAACWVGGWAAGSANNNSHNNKVGLLAATGGARDLLPSIGMSVAGGTRAKVPPIDAAGGAAFGELHVVMHYPGFRQAACPGGAQVGSSLDSFRSTTQLEAHSEQNDTYTAVLRYQLSQAGTRVMLTFFLNSGVYEDHIPAECMVLCPSFSSAGMQAWGPRTFVTLPANASPISVDVWPYFCEFSGSTYVHELWSSQAQRPFNVTIRVPASLRQNMLPRPGNQMPSVLIRLDSQFFFPEMAGGGDTFLGGLSAEGVTRELIFIDVDFTLHGDPLWRHPLLVPTPLKGCPNSSAALESWPSISSTWEGYKPSYEKLKGDYGFGQADALLGFLFDEMLPVLAKEHLPSAPGGQELALRDLDVGLWGLSDSGYTAWYGAWARPGDFDVALMQTPYFLWNCGEALDIVAQTGSEWMRRARAGEFGARSPRFYMDHGMQEDPEAYTVPVEAMYGSLRKLGLEDGKDVFLVRGVGDGHYNQPFYKRAAKALVALYAAEGGDLSYSAPPRSVYWPTGVDLVE